MAYVDPKYIHRMVINTREKYELRVWCEIFNCSEKDLMKAVNKVGTNAGKIKSVLKSSLHA